MQIRQSVNLRDFSAMKLGGPAAYLCEVEHEDDLVDALKFAEAHNAPWTVIGEGANTIFTDVGYRGLVIKIAIPGLELNQETEGASLVIGGGVHWDDAVAYAVGQNLSGIEALSMIPGTSGAAPVQNIGAYGQEIADTLTDLRAYDTKAKDFITMTHEDCGFSYRSSIFKREPGRYIITSITLRLRNEPLKPPFYDSLERYLNAAIG